MRTRSREDSEAPGPAARCEWNRHARRPPTVRRSERRPRDGQDTASEHDTRVRSSCAGRGMLFSTVRRRLRPAQREHAFLVRVFGVVWRSCRVRCFHTRTHTHVHRNVRTDIRTKEFLRRTRRRRMTINEHRGQRQGLQMHCIFFSRDLVSGTITTTVPYRLFSIKILIAHILYTGIRSDILLFYSDCRSENKSGPEQVS